MANNQQPPSESSTHHCTDAAAFLKILHEHRDVFELRIINCPERIGGKYPSTVAGYFNNAEAAAQAILEIEKRRPPAIYVTLNQCDPTLLARGMNRLIYKAQAATSDADILRRRWLFVDIDPKRPTGVSSTDAELANAVAVSDAIESALIVDGWPEPLRGMSGNGRYLLWRIDLPNDQESRDLIKSVLQSMEARFGNDGAEVDLLTFNASRNIKVLGTIARKGDELMGIDGADDRPHRRSWFIQPDGPLSVVSIEQLRAVADTSEREPEKQPKSVNGKPSTPLDVSERARRYLEKIPGAVAGRKGHNQLLSAASAMVNGFNLSADEAMLILANDYNPRCVPPWSDKELRHKVDEAAKLPGERGKLLNERPERSPGVATNTNPDEPWPEPEQLPDPLPSVIPYSSDLLPDAVGDAIDDIAERMQCPPDFPAAAMLVAMAAVIGCRVGIRPRRNDDWLVVPNLWGCVVGRPSLKKSPAIATAEKRIRAIEARDVERLAKDIESARIDELLAESRIKQMKSDISKALKQGEEIEARRLAEVIQEMENESPPVPRRIITTDPTIEKLGDMLNVHRAGMLLWVDELVGWLRSLDREDKAGVRQQFLTFWNGQGRLNIDRIMRGETVVESPCVSLFGCATPGGLSDYVSAAVRGGRGDDGLVQRLQITVWPDSPKEYRHVDRWPDSPARKKLTEVFEVLADLEPAVFALQDEFDDAGIPWLRFDGDGQAVFDRWETALQKRLRTDDLPEAYESHLSKYASMVPSIALILHLASGERGPVNGKASALAVRWAEYLESHATRVYAIATAPERQSVKPLIKRLIDWPEGKPIRVRTIREKGWSGLGDTESIERALELLTECGWVRAVQSKPTNGRPTVEYLVHPEAAKYFAASRNGTPETLPKGTFDGFEGTEFKEVENNLLPTETRVRGVI
jgi:Protein of unknown function (DUF3987)